MVGREIELKNKQDLEVDSGLLMIVILKAIIEEGRARDSGCIAAFWTFAKLLTQYLELD